MIVRYLSNEATVDEIEQLFHWVHNDPDHLHIFNECIRTWSHRVSQEFNYDLSNGLKNLNARIDELESENKNTVWFARWRNIAAVAAIVLCAGILVYLLGGQESTELILTQKVAPSGVKLALSLSDGSKVKLNSNTTLKYPETFDGEKREVYLTGEAYFEIQKDSLHPFIIHTGDLTTQVLGTSFNVNAQEDNITVTVATGKVRVSQGNNSKVLHPKEKVRYQIADHSLIQSIANLETDLAWRDDVILFNDTPLYEAAKKLEAWYGIEIHFENEAIKSCPITGRYVHLPVDKVLHAVSFSTGVQYDMKNNLVTFSGAGCN